MVGDIQHFCCMRIIVYDDFQRIDYAHNPWRVPVQLFANAVLKKRKLNIVVAFGNADTATEIPDACRRVTSSAHPGDCRQSRIVPAIQQSSHQPAVSACVYSSRCIWQMSLENSICLRMNVHREFIQDPIV